MKVYAFVWDIIFTHGGLSLHKAIAHDGLYAIFQLIVQKVKSREHSLNKMQGSE
jgi:hypothetical protein